MFRNVFTLVMCIVLGAGLASAVDIGKGQEQSRTGPSIESMGGPDGFGYNFIDNNESNGHEPTFIPLDITASGTALGLADDGVAVKFTTDTVPVELQTLTVD